MTYGSSNEIVHSEMLSDTLGDTLGDAENILDGSMIYEERPADSPFVESIIQGRTLTDNQVIRPAESHWHMVFSKREGVMFPLVVGPWTSSGMVSWKKDAEILWIKFKLGTFISHLPTKRLLNTEITLPDASKRSFWLKSSTWQFPTFENAETFVHKLVREDVLVRDPVVNAALSDQLPDMSARTVRHRFLQATGLSRNSILQMQRAHDAMTLLEEGRTILDVVYQMGYSDQPHLTRSLKQYTGYTPGQIASAAP